MQTFRHRLSVVPVIFCAAVLGGCWKRPQPWTPNPAPPLPQPNTGEFNVLWDKGDPNGFPHNPYWAAQAAPYPMHPPPLAGDEYDNKCIQEPYLNSSQVTPGKQGCTSQPTLIDQPEDFPDILCFLEPGSTVHGHVDWMVTSATGYISWLNLADDWDYNFRFIPASETSSPQQDRGITTNNNHVSDGNSSPYIELEFASSEVADQFQSPWWKGLAKQVDSLNWDALPSYLHPTNTKQDPSQ